MLATQSVELLNLLAIIQWYNYGKEKRKRTFDRNALNKQISEMLFVDDLSTI